MANLTIKIAEETLRSAIENLDKRVQLLSVNDIKKKDMYRVSLLKDGRSGSADISKEVIKTFLAGEGKGQGLRKALGKAVSRLSINYRT
ncbi:MAG: hypothetical protein V3S89_10095 [Desulfobacterales bacterium]